MARNETNIWAEARSVEAREKYVRAWNDTMIGIWKERITLLDVIDTRRLLNSPMALPVKSDGRFLDFSLEQCFLEYGIWQDFGTGKEVPRGNSGDIGRTKVRERRKWFSTKYFASVMNLREFLAESIGDEMKGLLADAIAHKYTVKL